MPQCIMDSAVRKSLRVPIRKLSSCVSGEKEEEVLAKRRQRLSREGSGGGVGGGGRGVHGRPGRSAPLRAAAHPREPAALPSYQADLDKERQQREALNAQKNAERAAMRAHFRRKYQLTKSSKDTNHLRPFGGKISLPRELAKIVHSDSKGKDDGFNLLKSFQGLSFNMGGVTGAGRSKIHTPQTANGDACQVM
ncbi:Complexin-4 [Merluccius polli]|uniref:Complexin-4 n=1 Tax=Merluccius polli TaxID=89951 RepID=A0AA47MFE4_MERPO|nr:Complexin-4 [Merluccius polli]